MSPHLPAWSPLLVCAAALSAGTACSPAASGGPRVRVFAAASAADAVDAALDACAGAGAPPVRAVTVAAASSTLARQIEAGAPAQLFVSASPQWMQHLREAGRIAPGTERPLLGNGLVVVAPHDSGAPFTLEQGTPLAALLDGQRLAVADPDHVPAGVYAKEALERLALWPDLEGRLARAADARAALALVERGEVPLGIVYATDAAASPGVVQVAAVPSSTHTPIVYPMAIVAGQREAPGAELVWDCLQTAAATAVFAELGFGRP